MIILEELHTEFGLLKVYEHRSDRSRIYSQDSWSHSWADIRGHSLISYVHVMYAALVQAQARRVAMLGCAGGTLATMLAEHGCEVTAVDINPYTFDLARRYFRLSPNVHCVLDDARHYLETAAGTFDGIAVDAFSGGVIPAHLRTVEFFKAAAARLNPGGLIVVNVIMAHDLDMLADNVAASLRAATDLPVSLLDDQRHSDRNVVIIAGHLPDLALPCGNEPSSVRKELQYVAPRSIRRQAVAEHDQNSL